MRSFYKSALHAKYGSVDQIKKKEMGRHVTYMGDRRGAHRVLMVRPDRKRPLGRCRHRWENNIKMDLPKVGCWEAQDRNRWQELVNAVRNLQVPQDMRNFMAG